MIMDVPTSSVALAVNQITREKNKVFIVSGAAASRPHRRGLLAQHDPLDLRHLCARPGHRRRHGEGRRRHLVLPHRGLRLRPCAGARHRGHRRPRTAARWSARSRRPFPGTDFSSFLLQAQASKAKVIGLANAGGDTINSIKQAGEFGIVAGGQKLAGLLVFITDVNALGLQTAQGLVLTEILLLGHQRPDPRLRRTASPS